MTTIEHLQQLQQEGELRSIDVEIGFFLARLAEGDNDSEPLALVAAMLSRALAEGHVCLPLTEIVHQLATIETTRTTAAKIRETLIRSGIVGSPGETAPLILDARHRLYFHRFHRYETTIADGVLTRCAVDEPIDAQKARSVLCRLFPDNHAQAVFDWQCAAVALSLLRRFVVVSGGPGTGKTFTVARILAAQARLFPACRRIRLAAPTGKAAARLKESLQEAKATLPHPFADGVPEEAITLHRLLRYNHHTHRFFHDQRNPLHLDMLLIDEASMIDVPLMAAVLKALPPECRLVLCGDKNQLASVEAGNLLTDLCGSEVSPWSPTMQRHMLELTGQAFPACQTALPLENCLVHLRESRRFGANSGIAALATAVNSRSSEAVTRCCSGHSYPDLTLHEGSLQLGAAAPAWFRRFILEHLAPVFTASSPDEALRRVDRCRILCALHQGVNGVERCNALVESILRREGYISRSERGNYPGRPLMILQNDYSLGLFNGDTGVLWPNQAGDLQAWFPQADGSLRAVSRLRLPPHQTGYAITVHKSQGSEFAHVLLVLPDRDTPILTRELLYTGITRARQSLTIRADLNRLLEGTLRSARRFSGLAERLRSSGETPPG